MASGKALLDTTPFRGLIIGYPGGGKTGAISALANVGYKVRFLDFEGNYAPLLTYTDPKALGNIDILTFQDKLTNNDRYIAPIGIPSAFNKSLKAMMEWKTMDDAGAELSLGKSAEWGSDTVVVLDSLTGMGEAAFRRAQVMANKTPMNTTQAVWGAAVADQLNMLKIMMNNNNKFHVIVLAHLTMIGPADITKDDDDMTKDLKREVAELLPTRLYPKAVTKNLSQFIAKEFPVMLLADRKMKLGKTHRVLRTENGDNMDLKFPAPNAPSEVPIDTGLATLFELLGHKAPGL